MQGKKLSPKQYLYPKDARILVWHIGSNMNKIAEVKYWWVGYRYRLLEILLDQVGLADCIRDNKKKNEENIKWATSDTTSLQILHFDIQTSDIHGNFTLPTVLIGIEIKNLCIASRTLISDISLPLPFVSESDIWLSTAAFLSFGILYGNWLYICNNTLLKTRDINKYFRIFVIDS